MYQTPVSDGHNVARSRSSVKEHSDAQSYDGGSSAVDMEGGAASYAERMDAATSHPPPNARASRAYTKTYPPPANMFPVLAGILAAAVVLSI